MIDRLLRFIFGKGSSVKRGSSLDKQKISQHWNEIEDLVKMGGASRLKSAIIDADKLLDYTLKAKGLHGETMADRLRSGQKLFSRSGYDAAWRGHKLRNRLVHEIDVDVLHFEVKKGLDDFKIALGELGAL